MKKLLATLLVALFCIGLIGCGVPQEEYTKVVGERDELAAGQIELENQLEKTSAELDALSQKLEELEAENQKLSGDLTTANQTIQDLSSKITDLENQLSQKTAEAEQLSSEKSTSSSKNSTSSDNSDASPDQKSGGGATVYITKTGEKYHTGGCSCLKKSKIAISLSEAKADGYSPCSRCSPPS